MIKEPNLLNFINESWNMYEKTIKEYTLFMDYSIMWMSHLFWTFRACKNVMKNSWLDSNTIFLDGMYLIEIHTYSFLPD